MKSQKMTHRQTEESSESKKQDKKFAIYAKTFTLGVNSQSSEDTILGRNTKYVIPIYQRSYCWTKDHITKLLADIFRSYRGYDKASDPEPMFIGTMQLSAPDFKKEPQATQEIVDGQQRISTFYLLLKVLFLKYPFLNELQDITFDWLETRVNNGEQDKLLKEFSSLSLEQILSSQGQNRYTHNARLIINYLDAELSFEDEKEVSFSIGSFIQYLLSNVYFVVIETHAGLSKTLQIFNAINSTGLDLNGADVFKIRMYEYMRSKQGFGEEAFELISQLYAKIDFENKSNKNNLSINNILNTYQNILIARHNLPQVLYSLGTDSFYDRLFDTVFSINDWKNFSKVKEENVKLDLKELEDIFEFHLLWTNTSVPLNSNKPL